MQSDNNTKTPSDEGAPPPPFKDDKEEEGGGKDVAQTEMPLGANTHDTMDMSSSSSDDKSDEPLIETTPPDSLSRQPFEIDDKQESNNSSDSSSNSSEQGAAGDNDEDPTSTSSFPKRNNKNNNGYTKTAISLFLLAFIIFVIVDSATNQWIKSGINAFLEWMEEEPIAGFFAFVALCFLTTMLFIPGILLTVGSGFVFANAFGLGVGMVLGILAAFTGAFCGSVLSFLLGRFLLRDCVGGLTKKFTLLEALDNALEEKGFRIMALLRLSPLIYASPYLNYGMGGTSISFRDFTLAMFAILPGTAMFVFLGASANSLSEGSDDDDHENDDEEQDEDDDSAVTTIILVVGIVVSVIAVAFTSYYAKMELDKVVAANRRQEEDSDDGHEAAAMDMVADDSAGPTAAPLLEGNRVVC